MPKNGKGVNTMKKTAVIILTAAAITSAYAPLHASAADSVNIRFSLETLDQITYEHKTVTGELTVTDVNGDGRINPDDAMYLAHEKYYPGGAAAGYDSTYIWGVDSCYTCNITDLNDFCVYTSSGPYHTRYTLEDGDEISWTAQFLAVNDFYGVSLKNIPDPSQNTFPVGTELILHVDCTPHLKKDAGSVSTEGMIVAVNGNTVAYTDRNGDAKITLSSAGVQDIWISKVFLGETVCTYRINAYEPVSYRAANDETQTPVQTTTTAAAETTTAAAETATTVSAASETIAQTTSATASAATTTAATTTVTAASALNAPAKAGNVKTGDATPIAALFIAGLGAAGAAVVCTAKRREE